MTDVIPTGARSAERRDLLSTTCGLWVETRSLRSASLRSAPVGMTH